MPESAVLGTPPSLVDTPTEPVLSVSHLSVTYPGQESGSRAVEDVSLDLHRGEIVAVVGESGSGKSTLVRSVIRLLPASADIRGTIGVVGRDGTRYDDLLALPDRTLRQVRGKVVGFVPQSTSGALNPVISIRRQFELTLRSERMSRKEIRERAIEALFDAGVRDFDLVWQAYPHELSGGLAQRVVIALAICKRPSVLLADEPTTALDPIVQADVLARLRHTVMETRSAALLITHDLGVAARYADRIVVMLHGRAVESGAVGDVVSDPRHPYTRELLASGMGRGAALLGTTEPVAGDTDEKGADR
ncbi:ABC transporter ATP-binding protein [Rhodococcus sp. Z13]|uniref:ABC transporter ATP-binding protein n=1 Tax=Rhodococcus sacchari TaxID=2962047 RepID=A0ACD4DJM0_9NOCA|nr:ABC transporter ATP-binding protein [Rhodococcus sp. Z13]UYP20240.1 ABC transporter ATP-binding protein [Rhodococcus sp. Z13]